MLQPYVGSSRRLCQVLMFELLGLVSYKGRDIHTACDLGRKRQDTPG